MTANVEGLLKEGIRAFKAKNKAEARQLFEKATELDQYSEQAWLWLSAAVDSEEDQRVCLENVLFINPGNAAARKGLDQLNAKRGSTSGDDYSVPPTATSSASSVFAGEDVSPSEYDNMVAGLGIKRDDSASSSSSPFTSVFTGDFDDTGSSASFGTDEEDFADDPFNANASRTSAASTSSAFVNYDEDEEEDEVYAASDDLDTGVDDSGGFGFADDDDYSNDTFAGPFSVQSSADDVLESRAPTRDTAPRAASRAASGASAPRKPASEMSSGLFGGFEDTSGGGHIDDTDPGEYFKMIPKEIKVTRLPGESPGAPKLLVLLTAALFLANLAAAGLLITRLMG